MDRDRYVRYGQVALDLDIDTDIVTQIWIDADR